MQVSLVSLNFLIMWLRFCLGFVVSDVKTKYAGATIVMSFDFKQ